MRTTPIEYDARRNALVEIMGRHRLSCDDVARMLERKPQTVRAWRNGSCPISDHTLRLLWYITREFGQ